MAVTREHMYLQCFRLRRHYKFAAEHLDPVSLLDVTHCLRIWVDMKADVDSVLQASGLPVVFMHAPKNRQLLDATRGAFSVRLPLASGWSTPSMLVRNVMLTDRVLSDEEIQRPITSPAPEPSTLSFSQWLGVEVYEVRMANGERVGLSREIFIKRVANILGASHPMGTEEGSERENRFDRHIRELHEFHLAEVPATFYQLMEIATDLIEAVAPVFPVPPSEESQRGV